MDFNALRMFVAVAESGSFSGASNKLGLPKWAASRIVLRLEADMGVPLLYRTTRHVSLSPAGADLYARIAPLVSSLEAAASAFPSESGSPAGKVHITVPSFLQTPLIPEALGAFAARYPAVHVAVTFNTGFSLSAGDFDIAFWLGRNKLQDSSLVARRGWRLEGQFFASPKYLAIRGTPTSLADLADHEQISFASSSAVLEQVGFAGSTETLDGAREPVIYKSEGRIRSNDILFMLRTIRSGAGIGLLPTFLADEDVAAGRLVTVLPQYHSLDHYIYIIRPNTHEVPHRVRALSDFLFEFMKANPLVHRAEATSDRKADIPTPSR